MRRRYLSFEDRGVLVGFQGKRLGLVRCRPKRDDGKGYEALIPNWTGDHFSSFNDMVLPFAGLATWAPIEGYNRALFDRVVAQAAQLDGHMDPILMRDIRLATDIELGDERAQQVARFEVAITERDAQRSLLEVIAMFGRDVADRVRKDGLAQLSGDVLFHLADRSPEELRQLVKIIAGAVARGGKLSGEELSARLDRIAEFAAPISSLVTEDSDGVVGYLSRQFKAVERLHDGLKAYGEGNSQTLEMQSALRLVCANTMSFMLFAHARAQDIRRQVLEDRRYLDEAEHERLLQAIGQERVRIAFALDGWAMHADAWERAGASPAERDAVIARIMRDMPKPPVEVDEELIRVKAENDAVTFRGRTVMELHSWANDSLDEELYERVKAGREASKAATPAAVAG
jgi:hypothetical protein